MAIDLSALRIKSFRDEWRRLPPRYLYNVYIRFEVGLLNCINLRWGITDVRLLNLTLCTEHLDRRRIV